MIINRHKVKALKLDIMFMPVTMPKGQRLLLQVNEAAADKFQKYFP